MSQNKEELVDNEIIEEIDEIEKEENKSGYSLVATFNKEKYNKLLKLNMEKPEYGIIHRFRDMFKRKRIILHEYYEQEKAVTITQAEGNIRFSLINKRSIDLALRKIKNESTKEKIQYIYLAEIQILIKSLFKEGIDSPIVLSLHDQRFTDPSIGHLGTIEGNLCYTKLLFICHPRYCVHIKDKNIDETLSLHFKLLKKNLMKEGNRIMTIHYSALYSFCNSNYGEIYGNKPYIEINKDCEDIATFIEPVIQDYKIPINYELNIDDRKQFLDNSNENSIIPISFAGRTLVRGSSSRRLSTDKQIIKSVPTNNVIKILGQYFNGIDYTTKIHILLDTGTSHNYMNHTKNKGLLVKEKEIPYEYTDFNGNKHICKQEVKVPIIIEGLRIIVACYIDSFMTTDPEKHIVLGNSFLNDLEYYKIEPNKITFLIQGQKIICETC